MKVKVNSRQTLKYWLRVLKNRNKTMIFNISFRHNINEIENYHVFSSKDCVFAISSGAGGTQSSKTNEANEKMH